MANIHETLQAAIESLAIETGLDIRLGYIGNLERWGDDRQWNVWVQGIYERRNGNTLSVGGWETKNLDRLLAEVENGRVEQAIMRATYSQAFGFRDVKDWRPVVVMEAAEVEDFATRVAHSVIEAALVELEA